MVVKKKTFLYKQASRYGEKVGIPGRGRLIFGLIYKFLFITMIVINVYGNGHF